MLQECLGIGRLTLFLFYGDLSLRMESISWNQTKHNTDTAKPLEELTYNLVPVSLQLKQNALIRKIALKDSEICEVGHI